MQIFCDRASLNIHKKSMIITVILIILIINSTIFITLQSMKSHFESSLESLGWMSAGARWPPTH